MPNLDKHTIVNITTGSILRVLLVAGLVYVAFLISDILASILLSVVIASGVNPAAKWFQKFGIPRVIAVIIVYLCIFSLLGLLFYLVIPPVFSELNDLADNAPKLLDSKFQLKLIKDFIPELPASVSQLMVGVADSMKGLLTKFTSGFFHATSIIFGSALSFFIIFVLSFYLSVQEKGIENFLRIVIPLKYEEYAVDLWTRSSKKIGEWFKGQILLAALVGIFVFIGLTILKIKYAIVFALLAAMFEIIPIFGPILSAIPPIGVAFLQNPAMVVPVIILYFIIQQFENHLLYPVVVHKFVGVPSILVIISLLIGAKIGGFMGLLLSIPIATVLVEYFSDMEKKKRTNST